MKLKDFRLDVEALFAQSVYGHGHLHYGYWKDEGTPSVASIEKLGEAQINYFNKLVETIPDDVATILDVGSGTGSNAASLIDKGYSVDCVCPSTSLNKIAAKKLPEESTIFECEFEEFRANKTYDALIFAESFHYLHADIVLEKGIECSKKYILIFDYFRKRDSENYQRISYSQFLKLLNESFSDSYEILYDEDVTNHILPTFLVIDKISNDYFKPFLVTAASRFKKEHPVYNLLFGFFISKITRFANKKNNRYKTFAANNEYRLILLSKKNKN